MSEVVPLYQETPAPDTRVPFPLQARSRIQEICRQIASLEEVRKGYITGVLDGLGIAGEVDVDLDTLTYKPRSQGAGE